MVTHLAFITKNGKKQKTLALNNKKRGKAKSTQKKQKHTYLITDRHTFLTVMPELKMKEICIHDAAVDPVVKLCLVCVSL